MPGTPKGSGFKVDPGSGDGQMSLMIMDGETSAIRLTIDAQSASKIAAGVLAGAKTAFELSGKPPPYTSKDDPISLTAVACSGWSIGPDQTEPSAVMLIFHFGETALGIRVPRTAVQLLAQRLLTVAAPTDLPHRH
jgi:hypothetical protein